MIITRLENFEKNKVKIFVDDLLDDEIIYVKDNGYFCFLYKTEIYKYKLKVGSEINKELLNKILDNLKSRTNNKCEAILSRNNQTKKSLYDKLILKGYNPFFIDLSIQKMEEYGYINDYQFATDYFENNKNKKSLKIIKQTLLYKGIPNEILEDIIDEDFNQDDIVQSLINKKLKGRDWDALDYKEKSKIKSYIYSKGYKFPNNLI